MAEVLGHLGLQRRLDDPAGQLGQQPARAGELLGLKALDGVIQRLLGQQPGEAVDDLLRRLLGSAPPACGRRLDFMVLMVMGSFLRAARRPDRPLAPPGLPSQAGTAPCTAVASPRPHTLHRTDPRIARDELRRIRELSHTIKALETEIAQLVATIAPQLLTEPGFGPLTAAKLVGEIAGAPALRHPAKLARAAGVAPIPASSGNTQRQRLDQGGNRQINAALHRVIVTRTRCHPATQDYIARRRAEGKTTREATRCLKHSSPATSGSSSNRPTPTKEHRHHR